MPWTPDSSTWSALLNASMTLTCLSLIDSSRSFGMTMRVSTSCRRVSMPDSAWPARRRPSKENGPRDDADRERAERAGDVGDDGRAAGAGATALAGGHEDHVGALEHLLDLLAVVLGGLPADLGGSARAEAAGQLAADVELDVGVAHEQRLRVGVDRDELHTAEPDLDHPVDGVDATTADADHLDDGEVVLRSCHGDGGLPGLGRGGAVRAAGRAGGERGSRAPSVAAAGAAARSERAARPLAARGRRREATGEGRASGEPLDLRSTVSSYVDLRLGPGRYGAARAGVNTSSGVSACGTRHSPADLRR